MSLATPDKIRRLQRKLYTKAKQEPRFRFHQLYDKVYRADILRHAWELSRRNGGAPGVDGVSFEAIESAGLEEWLARLGIAARAETLAREHPGQAEVIVAQRNRLCDPDQMGDLFKVMAVHARSWPAPAGFEA